MKKFVKGCVHVAQPIFRVFYPTKVYGRRKVDFKKSLLVSNHLSGFDMLVYVANLKTIVPFLYKVELRKHRFVRWVCDGLDGIPVHRGEVDINASRLVLKTLKNDSPLFVFPEGTRNPNVDCLQEFHTGVALFALKTHAPIVPCYVWEKAKMFRKNYIVVGEEMTLEKYYDEPITKELLIEATEDIKNEVDKLRLWLNAELAKKGVKRRKRTAKETQKIIEYNEKQKTLAKTLAEQKEQK